MKTLHFILFLFILPFLFLACNKDENGDENPEEYEIITPENPQHHADRIYGINVSESIDGFEASFQKAQEAGIEVVELNIPWNAIETGEGIYEDPWGGVLEATAFYAQYNIKVCFSIAVINTVKWEVPAYLEEVPSNDQQFINAFNNMIDWFIVNIPSIVDIYSISIGNEIDLVLESENDWNEYTTFFEEAANHIRTNFPIIKIGVKNTIMGGIYGSELEQIQSINEFSDVVMLNYYPQNDNFQVLEPDVVYNHMSEWVNYFPDKEIWLTEVGYQSGSEYCNSTELKQAEFYHHFFIAWDQHKDKIKFVLIDWLHDQSPETIAEWEDYYGNDPALVEYLSTLGLRNYDGTDKPAWLQLKAEVSARNW